MKITVLYPSFDWKLKLVLNSLLLYECENEIEKWQEASSTLRYYI
jgi:hypothetical protein